MKGLDFYQAMNLIDNRFIDEALAEQNDKTVRRTDFLPIKHFLAAAALFLLVFTAVINLFPKTAYAVSKIPLIGDLAKIVTFDPSMRACLKNNYAQYVGETQTIKGIRSEVCFMVVDANSISVFFKSDLPHIPNADGNMIFHADISNADGSIIPSCGGINETRINNFYEFRMDLQDDTPIPEVITLHLTYYSRAAEGEAYTINEGKAEYTLHPDKTYAQVVKSYDIHVTKTIMGQNVHFDRLDVYPTKSKLYVSTDEANTALLKNIEITLYDDKGNAYEAKQNGLTALTEDLQILAKLYESPYFSQTKTITAIVSGVAFMDKSKVYGAVDYANKSISNLPADVSVASMILDDQNTLEIALKVYRPNGKGFQQMAGNYKDVNGNEYYFDHIDFMLSYWSTYLNREIAKESEGYSYQVISIPAYEDGKYQIIWNYAPTEPLADPIEITIHNGN